MRIVLDTNVLVSGLLSPHGSPARVMRFALRGDLVVLFDDRILAEYREVLSRPKFGFDPGDVKILVGELERKGEPVLALPLPIELPDPDDLPFLEVAVAGAADLLVTGSARHYRSSPGSHGVRLASPAATIEQLAVGRGRTEG